jgi:hypothetical protein
MRFSRGRHIQTCEGRECPRGWEWGCILMGRVNLRDPPPPRARHTLTTRNHTCARSTEARCLKRTAVWSPRPRTNLTPLTHILLLSLRFCADARVHPPPHRPACAPPRLHQRPVAAGSSCLHLFTAYTCIKYCHAPPQHAGHLGTTSVSIHVKQQQTYPRYVYVHRSVMGAGLRVDAVVDFDAGEGGAPCVSLRAAGRHSACGGRAATGAAPGLVPRYLPAHVASL